ncbi:MAG TPA: protoheme IX farnesyltransferase, partial [Bacteroidetes bacterium]|nr:protoheme IX farnesyltransferase [Bacteroidota bacterium]
YAVGAGILGLWMTVEAVRFSRRGTNAAARRVLLTSYAVLMGVFLLMILDKQ